MENCGRLVLHCNQGREPAVAARTGIRAGKEGTKCNRPSSWRPVAWWRRVRCGTEPAGECQ